MKKQHDATDKIFNNLFSALEELCSSNANVDITLTSPERCGVIQIREGVVTAAHSKYLSGNGALLSLARVVDPTISIHNNTSPTAKTVSIPVAHIKKLAVRNDPENTSNFTEDQEQQIFEEAKTLFFQFRHKLAAEKLLSLLRSNKFYYPAWLWESRIFTRTNYISKALDEACRWGAHDLEIHEEAQKIRPQLNTGIASVRRCFLCSAILAQQSCCSHCEAYLCITNKRPRPDLKNKILRQRLALFQKAYLQKPEISHLAYVISICHFNLEEYRQAHYFMNIARKNSPNSNIYTKSIALLSTVLRSRIQERRQHQKKPRQRQKLHNENILLVENKHTLRKMLQMLLERNGYEVFAAINKAEIQQHCLDNNIDLIISDSTLYHTIEETAHLKSLPNIVLLNPREEKRNIKKQSQKNIITLPKPFNPQKLLFLVRKHFPLPPETFKKEHIPASPNNEISEKPVKKRETTTQQELKQEDKKEEEQEQKTIFVVEDSPISRKILSTLLSKHNFNVVTAASGKEVFSIASDIRPHLVLLDIMLPDTTGYEVLPKLKQIDHFNTVPVLFLTGKRSTADKMKGMLLGAQEYITKPFDPDNLIQLIKTYI